MFDRILNIVLPQKQSLFLWGARQTGKSSYLTKCYPRSLYFNLLNTELFLKYIEAPYLLREELLEKLPAAHKHPIIIDEIQKVPLLLNEVHLLIEQEKLQFILCGSSARKLKTHSTNLLGGRAWVYHFYPLVFAEIPQYNLLRALQHGLLPTHYQTEPQFIALHLQSYIDVYLTDEIRNEGLVRNLASFSKFLTIAGLCNTEMINMSNIARDCHVSRNTVEAYFQILIDTWLGYFIYPYHKKIKRELITAMPKFYFFDVGVANYLARRMVLDLKGEIAGRSLEHLILMELMAYRDIRKKRFDIQYWRSKTGLEVDFILDDAKIALEVKISKEVHQEDLKGMLAFCEEHPKTKAIVVSQDSAPRKMNIDKTTILTILPWKVFLERLWRDEII